MSHDYETKLKNLNLPGTTEVVLTYTDGCDVFVHNDTAVDTAIKNTDVVERFSELVEALTQKGDKTHWITEQLRDEYILDFDDEDEDGNIVVTIRYCKGNDEELEYLKRKARMEIASNYGLDNIEDDDQTSEYTSYGKPSKYDPQYSQDPRERYDHGGSQPGH